MVDEYKEAFERACEFLAGAEYIPTEFMDYTLEDWKKYFLNEEK